jgi:hypothetical protein
MYWKFCARILGDYVKKSVVLLSVLLVFFFSTISFADEEWVMVPGVFDPASVPKRFDVIVESISSVGGPAEVPIYPWTKTVSVTVNLDEAWYNFSDMVLLIPQQNGHYNVSVYFSVVNPSRQWAYALYMFLVALPEPREMVNQDTYRYFLFFPQNSYLLPYASNCTWNARSENVEQVVITCDVVAGGKIRIFQWGNQLRTDINKDGIVNIKDLYFVAIHYGERYTNSIYYDWNVLLDGAVTIQDVVAVTKEFGRQISP